MFKWMQFTIAPAICEFRSDHARGEAVLRQAARGEERLGQLVPVCSQDASVEYAQHNGTQDCFEPAGARCHGLLWSEASNG